MKKSIIVKYAWEDDEGFQIVGTDGGSKSGGGGKKKEKKTGLEEAWQLDELNLVLSLCRVSLDM